MNWADDSRILRTALLYVVGYDGNSLDRPLRSVDSEKGEPTGRGRVNHAK